MSILNQIQDFFSAEASSKLGQVVGLDAGLTQKALNAALPLQLKAISEHAANPAGQKDILDAINNIPRFGSVQEALSSNDGAGQLQEAGMVLAPALLGGKADEILNTVTRQVGGSMGGLQKLLNMSLPLLLSVLGRQGLNAGNLVSTLGGLDLSRFGLGSVDTAAAGVGFNPAVAAGLTGAGAGLGGALTADSFIDLVRAQFAGANAEKIGQAAGFSASNATRAVQGALPVVLNALANKGSTEAGATDLLRMATPFGNLVGADGSLNAATLGDAAEMTRIEGQGRGLLGSLYGNIDEMSGRLGTALSGSGSNASRLLAVMTPLVLGLLTKRAGTMNGAGLSGLLGGFGSRLSSLIPAGLPIAGLLGPVLASETVAAKPAVAVDKVTSARTEPVVTTPVAPAPPVETVVTGKPKSSFPWWLLPLLLLLLLGGYWLTRPKPEPVPAPVPVQNTQNTTPTTAGSIIVENPTSDSTLPAQDFTMSGKATANDELSIEDQGQKVSSATVDADGNWSASIPAPTVGEHTYSIIGKDGTKSEFKVNIADNATSDATTTPATDTSTDAASTDAASTDTTTPAGDTGYTISEPAADAQLPAGGFDLKGTGKAGDTVTIYEDQTSLGNIQVGDDGNWAFTVPSPAAGAHVYSVKSGDGTELSKVATTVAAPEAGASAANCTNDFTLSMADGQSVTEPFRFGGAGQGKGYTVTVFRDGKRIGRKDVYLDATCGWSYQSTPGKGKITYEVRELGKLEGETLGKVGLDVTN